VLNHQNKIENQKMSFVQFHLLMPLTSMFQLLLTYRSFYKK